MARIPALWQLCALSEVLLLLLLPHSPVHAAPQPAMAAAPFSAAFVGNSYTFYSDLPSMISSIAEAEGAALSWDANYPGGSALWQHADPDVYGPETEALLARGGWDYIVLQDQSQTPGGGRVTSGAPLGPGEGKVLSISALEEWFAPRLGAARPVLYSTWGRRDGDAANPEIFGTFSEMNHLTTLGYEEYAEALRLRGLDPIVVPAGRGFELVLEDSQGGGPPPPVSHAQLYWSQADSSHPSIQGTYLVACIFWGKLWGLSPVGVGWTPLLIPVEQADYLQRVAARALGMN